MGILEKKGTICATIYNLRMFFASDPRHNITEPLKSHSPGMHSPIDDECDGRLIMFDGGFHHYYRAMIDD
jgi:hypothetical protein